MSQMAHQAEADLGYFSMKRLGVFLLLTEWDANPSQGYLDFKFAGTQRYT